MPLIEIEENSANFRGQCTKCERKSFRWITWDHVEKWYEKHLCEPRKMTSTGLK